MSTVFLHRNSGGSGKVEYIATPDGQHVVKAIAIDAVEPDYTASAEDILLGKTALTNGSVTIGTLIRTQINLGNVKAARGSYTADVPSTIEGLASIPKMAFYVESDVDDFVSYILDFTSMRAFTAYSSRNSSEVQEYELIKNGNIYSFMIVGYGREFTASFEGGTFTFGKSGSGGHRCVGYVIT